MDVVQLGLEAFECAAAVVAEVAACAATSVAAAASNAIGQDEVDAARLPGSRVSRADNGSEGEENGGKAVEEQHPGEGDASRS